MGAPHVVVAVPPHLSHTWGHCVPLSSDAGFREGEHLRLRLGLEDCCKGAGESLHISPEADILQKARENGVSEF